MLLTAEQIRAVLKDKIPANFVVAEHTESGHYYRHTPTNQVFASVTTKCGILDAPHLKKWAAKLAVEYMSDEIFSHPGSFNERKDMIELERAAIMVHQDNFKDAGGIGTIGHGIIENYLKDWIRTGVRPKDIRDYCSVATDPRAWAIARSAEMFCIEWGAEPIVSEMFVASAKYKFAGTLDSLMMIRRVTKKGNGGCNMRDMITGLQKEHFYMHRSVKDQTKLRCNDCGQEAVIEFALVDWKSSNSIDKVEYAMQTSAYWQALYEMTGLRPKQIYVVRLDKDKAKYEVRVLVNRPAAFKAFVHTSKVYEWLNSGEDKLAEATPKQRISLQTIALVAPLEKTEEFTKYLNS